MGFTVTCLQGFTVCMLEPLRSGIPVVGWCSISESKSGRKMAVDVLGWTVWEV